MIVQTNTFFFLFSLLVLVPSISIAAPHPAFVRYRRQAEDAQKSNKLDPTQVMESLKQDGQSGTVEPGQVRALTSENNFINFCLTQDVPLTDGKQIPTGSCNQTPMGRIISSDKIPSCKFVFPPNGDNSIKENEAFTVKLQIQNMQTGFFANPNSNYYANPQTVNDQGLLIGHGHVVIEKIPSLDHADTLNPRDFAFFKGLNEVAQGGILSAEVSKGLPAGFYRMSSINSATTHQPALAAVAQHGSIDDGVYFEVRPANSVDSTSSADVSASASETASETASATSSADPAATSAADDGNGNDNGNGNNNGGNGEASATETSSAPPAASSAADNNDGKDDGDNGNGNGNGNGNNGNGNDGDNNNNGGNGNGNNGDNNASATSSAAPAETSAADNNNGGGDNAGNNGGNGNNNGGGDNDDDNNGGNNGGNGGNDNGNNGGDAATPTSSAAPAESSAAEPADGGNNDNGGNGNNGGGDNGGDGNQDGDGASATSSSAAPQESAAGGQKGGKSGNGRGRNKRRIISWN